MAKKKGASKKAGSKKRAADGELVILLPPDAHKEYLAILAGTELGQPTIDSMLLAVFGKDAKFHINHVSIGNRATYVTSPVSDSQPRKC